MILNIKDSYRFVLTRNTVTKTLKGGNQMISTNDRLHHHTKAQLTQYLRQLAGLETPTTQFSPERPCRVIINVWSPTRRTMDPPNWNPTVKALLDGLTDAGQWTDDNKQVILEVSYRYGGLTKTPKTYWLDIHIVDQPELEELPCPI